MHIQTLAAFLFVLSAPKAQGDPFPELGRPAPVFTAESHEGEKITVGGKSKTWTVLAFYPKALTGG